MSDISLTKIVAITGATGFIGKALVKKLCCENVKLRVLSRRDQLSNGQIDYFRADLANFTYEDATQFLDGADFLIHCGASLTDERNIKIINIEATKTLFMAADKTNIKRFIYLSSVGVYGQNLNGVISESQNFNPVGFYEESKAEAELMLLNPRIAPDLQRVIVRPSNVYGPGMVNQSLGQMITSIKKGYFIFVGKRGAIANYTHVENVADVILILLLADNNRHIAYNISESVTIEELTRIVNMTFSIKRKYLRLPKFIMLLCALLLNLIGIKLLTPRRVHNLANRTIYSSARLEKEYGYKPELKIDVGISDYAQSLEKDKLDEKM